MKGSLKVHFISYDSVGGELTGCYFAKPFLGFKSKNFYFKDAMFKKN